MDTKKTNMLQLILNIKRREFYRELKQVNMRTSTNQDMLEYRASKNIANLGHYKAKKRGKPDYTIKDRFIKEK